jgi:POT family proton-dependent oligopeptide transporter
VKEQTPGLLAQIRSYPRTFWVANTMEIFERMAWYGWFTVAALYIEGSTDTGGLGFSSEVRGTLFAVVPFFLYLLPVLTGALADRYGFKRMFVIAYLVMIGSYYMLGQFSSLPMFFMAFMFVAVGAAIFKPVVVGTVARVTDDKNSAIGFGIFYMMVNIGGFVGPIVAGVVRGLSWKYVFIACSFWAFVNLLIVIFLYKDPSTEAGSANARSFQKVMDDLVEVLGNVRFFITIGIIILALMVTSAFGGFRPWINWINCLYFCVAWLVLNFIYDRTLPPGSGLPTGQAEKKIPTLRKRMHCSNWRFALFLLIMSGFWTSFNQIFYTMPSYIRDFTETRPAITMMQKVYDNVLVPIPFVFDARDISPAVATVNDDERAVILGEFSSLMADLAGGIEPDQERLETVAHTLLGSKVRLTPDRIRELIGDTRGSPEAVTEQAIMEARQFNPEFIINFDAGAIVLFQVFVSFLMARFHRFTTMIVGMVVAAVGVGLSAMAGDAGMLGAGGMIWVVIAGIVIFAFGEMMASPTSQEYVGRIAPPNKVALYMGYYFVSIALGNLFGGILSGQLYAKLARDMQRPDLMWMIFGALMVFTAVVFVLYNRFALPKEAADSLTPDTAAGD